MELKSEIWIDFLLLFFLLLVMLEKLCENNSQFNAFVEEGIHLFNVLNSTDNPSIVVGAISNT